MCLNLGQSPKLRDKSFLVKNNQTSWLLSSSPNSSYGYPKVCPIFTEASGSNLKKRSFQFARSFFTKDKQQKRDTNQKHIYSSKITAAMTKLRAGISYPLPLGLRSFLWQSPNSHAPQLGDSRQLKRPFFQARLLLDRLREGSEWPVSRAWWRQAILL